MLCAAQCVLCSTPSSKCLSSFCSTLCTEATAHVTRPARTANQRDIHAHETDTHKLALPDHLFDTAPPVPKCSVQPANSFENAPAQTPGVIIDLATLVILRTSFAHFSFLFLSQTKHLTGLY